MVNLEDVLAKFQFHETYFLKSLALLFIAYVSNSLYADSYIFAADDIGYRCKDERFGNNSCATLPNSTDVCAEWVYDNPRSFVADLACQDWKRTLVGTSHNFGYMVGLLIVGPLSDRFGRKNLLIITGVLGGVFGVLRSFVTWFWIYIMLEFLEGAIGDSSSPAFMLVIEMVAKEKRVSAHMICANGFAVGSVLLALSAWLIPDFRIMLRVIYIPAFLFFAYYYLLDESPRWLLSKGRKKEAVDILEKAAVKSKAILDKNSFSDISYEEQTGLTFAGLLRNTFRSRKLLKRFFICLVWWIVTIFVNYGMTLNSIYLHGSKYVNYSLSTVVTMPVYILIIFFLRYCKRKTALFLCFISAALLLFVQPFLPSNLPWLSVVLYMVGKVISSSHFEITYIFTSEIFPTYTRNSMHALCSSIGRIGAIVAPQTPLLMVYWQGLPWLLFGTASLAAAVVTLFAPDTSHQQLPDTIGQAEAIGKHAIDKQSCIENNIVV